MLLSEQPIYSDVNILLFRNGLQWPFNSVLWAYQSSSAGPNPTFIISLQIENIQDLNSSFLAFLYPFEGKKNVMLDATNVTD